MKKLLALSLLSTTLLLNGAMAEVQLPEGTQELSVAGLIDLDAADDYLFSLDLKYGYFVKDNWELGGKLGATGTGSNKSASIGLFTEYNFTNQSDWVPYVGAAFNAISIDSDKVDVNSTISGEFSLGVKYFVNPNVAIRGEARYEVSKDDVNFSEDNNFTERFKDSSTKIYLGTSFYF